MEQAALLPGPLISLSLDGTGLSQKSTKTVSQPGSQNIKSEQMTMTATKDQRVSYQPPRRHGLGKNIELMYGMRSQVSVNKDKKQVGLKRASPRAAAVIDLTLDDRPQDPAAKKQKQGARRTR